MNNKTKNVLLLISTILLIFFTDRILLWYLGLPLWEWDQKLHYKQRSNYKQQWHTNKNKYIITNEYGFHDNSFHVKKKNNELRILNLGDSITMGHGVTRDETYSKYLEQILESSLEVPVEAINTGVQGYSTFQELEMLKRTLKFNPDIVTIGFCLNDVTEPFAVNKNLGGTGLDYHRVTQAPNMFLSFLINETGFGRLIQEIRIRSLYAENEKLLELNEVKNMINNPEGERYKEQWKFTLKELEKTYDLCKNKNLPSILLIFPYTFQIGKNELHWPQKLLSTHAQEHGVIVIDLLEIFEQMNPGTIKSLYLDEDHFTPEGHKLVAKELSQIIQKEVLLGNKNLHN